MSSGNGGHGGPAAAFRDPETDKARLRAIHESLTAGDVASAGKLAEDALGDGIDHPMVLSVVAGRREAEGRFEDSLDLLRRAKAAAPEATGIMNAIGLCLLWLGRNEEAVAEFDAALAIDPDFAPAHANRGTGLVALARLVEGRRAFEAACALDRNLVAVNGLAALALRRGDPAEARRLAAQVAARQPNYHEALTTLAGADIAEGLPGEAEIRLRHVLEGPHLPPLDRAIALGTLGDALDAQGRFHEAYAAYDECNRIRREHFAPIHGDGPGTLALVRELTGAIAGRRVPGTWGRVQGNPARRHVFLVGFPRSGATLIEQVLAGHPEVATLSDQECLIDSARQYLGDSDDIAHFCEAEDEELDPWRDAYWRRVGQAGVNPADRVLVDKNPFNTFKLPLIARLFPEARILIARRDPRDAVLSCLRSRFPISDPVYQMLTPEGAAGLFAATMELVEAVERSFGLFVQPCQLEKIVADFEGEMRAVCATLDIEWTPELADFARHVPERGVATPRAAQLAEGLNARGIGRWRNYAGELAPILQTLQPWAERLGYG